MFGNRGELNNSKAPVQPCVVDSSIHRLMQVTKHYLTRFSSLKTEIPHKCVLRPSVVTVYILLIDLPTETLTPHLRLPNNKPSGDLFAGAHMGELFL